MARTKMTPQKGEVKKTLAEVHATPVPDEEAPPTSGKIERRKVEAAKLEEVGRSLESLPTQQLAQMAAEAGPSTLGGEEPASRKLQSTLGGKAPQKEFLKARRVKKAQRNQPGTVAFHEICWLQKSIDLLICKQPFS